MFSCVLAALFCVAAPAGDRLRLADGLIRRGLAVEAVAELESLKNDPAAPKAEVYFRLGEAQRARGDAAAAIRAYGDSLTADSASRFAPYARLNRALVSSGEARWADFEALDRDGVPPAVRATALYHLGSDAETRQDVKTAVGYYRRAIKAAPKGPLAETAHLRLATVLSASADSAERREGLAHYLDLAGSSDARLAAEAQFFAGLSAYRDARYADALAVFNRFLAQRGGHARVSEARRYAAWSAYLLGRHNDVLALVGAMASSDDDGLYLRVLALEALERRADARAAAEVYLKAFPAGRHAPRVRAERVFLASAERDAAGTLSALDAAGDLPADLAARAYLCGVEAARLLGDEKRALEYARRTAAVKDSPLAPRGLYEGGVLEARAGRIDAACADWTELLARWPDSPYAADALRARAMEEIRLKHFTAANRTLEELGRRFPEKGRTADALYWRGVAARGADDAPAAEKLFREALAAQPTDEFAREIELELAFLLRARGADDEALKLFSAVLATKTAERLPPETLAWVAERSLDGRPTAESVDIAARFAETLVKRNADPTWNQIGGWLVGSAAAAKGETDAACRAWRTALAEKARTDAGARSALALGTAAVDAGRSDEAETLLADAIERAGAPSGAPVRLRAYAALAANAEKRKDSDAALRYHLLLATLFDDPERSPAALSAAAAILRSKNRVKDAEELEAERARRYGR